jgi:hypothetical protein
MIKKKPHTRRVKARKEIGQIKVGEIYPLLELKAGRYWVDVRGITLSYPLDYFFYL